MAILRIFDASQYISAGISNVVAARGVVEGKDSYRSNEMPVGGVSYLLNTIHCFREEGTDLVYCFDRTPTIKRDLHKKTFPHMCGYKGNRGMKKKGIIEQRALAEEVIRQLGLCVIAEDGYEADDCIASIVKYYKPFYEKIYIHNTDSDMFYLVNENVSVVPLLDVGKTVTLSNWEMVVHKDYIIPYNSLTLNKLLCGEMSDNVPRISVDMANRIKSYIKPELYKDCGNNALLRKWVSNATNGDETVMGTLNLIMPFILPEASIEIVEEEFNKDLFEFYAVEFGNKFYRNYVAKGSDIGEETINRHLDEYNNNE